MSPSLRPALLTGYLVCFAIILVLFGWGSQAQLAGAVIAEGQVVVAPRRQLVQHPDGGVITRFLVADGDQVRQGQVLMMLDDSALRSGRDKLADELAGLWAEAARLTAERDGRTVLSLPAGMAGLVPPGRLAELGRNQQALFAARRDLAAQVALASADQIRAVAAGVAGLEGQLAAARRQLALTGADAADAARLADRGLAERPRLTALQREVARLEGLTGQISAEIAADRARIAELQAAAARALAEQREAVIDGLGQLDSRITGRRADLAELDNRLARLALRAPMDGVVQDLRFHAVGAVVRAAEPVMSVIPTGAERTILARIDIRHADRLFVGQAAGVRFPSRDARATLAVPATLVTLAPDATVDDRTGQPFYTAELRLDPGAGVLPPGAPAEVYFTTGTRTPLALLFSPLGDYFARALSD